MNICTITSVKLLVGFLNSHRVKSFESYLFPLPCGVVVFRDTAGMKKRPTLDYQTKQTYIWNIEGVPLAFSVHSATGLNKVVSFYYEFGDPTEMQ